MKFFLSVVGLAVCAGLASAHGYGVSVGAGNYGYTPAVGVAAPAYGTCATATYAPQPVQLPAVTYQAVPAVSYQQQTVAAPAPPVCTTAMATYSAPPPVALPAASYGYTQTVAAAPVYTSSVAYTPTVGVAYGYGARVGVGYGATVGVGVPYGVGVGVPYGVGVGVPYGVGVGVGVTHQRRGLFRGGRVFGRPRTAVRVRVR